MRALRLSRVDGFALRNIQIVRHDGVVHIAYFTEGPPTILVAHGTPVSDAFRLQMRCDKTVKMHCGGKNRFTDAAPTCFLCIAGQASRE